MSNRVLIPLTLAFALVLSLGSAQAGPISGSPTGPDPFDLTFNENGQALVNQNGMGNRPDPGIMNFDPTTGMLALSYALPEAVVLGAVGINEFNSSALSDVINFYQDAAGAYWMAMYSGDKGGQLADTGIPAQFQNGNLFIGTSEDANGNFTWLPGGNRYFGQSPELSQTPEPASLTLAGLNILGVLAVRYRLRRRSAEQAV